MAGFDVTNPQHLQFLVQQIASGKRNPALREAAARAVAQLSQAVQANPGLAFTVGEALSSAGVDRATQNVILNSSQANTGGGLAGQANAAVSGNASPILPPAWKPGGPNLADLSGKLPNTQAGISGDPRNIGGGSSAAGQKIGAIASDDTLPGGVQAGIQTASQPGTQAGVGNVNFDPTTDSGLSQAPGDAYFKGATPGTIGEVTPGFTKSDAENNPAWQYYLAQSGMRDTYAEDSLKDDFMAAEMMQRLLGQGDIQGKLNPADQLYGTQQLMGQMSTSGGGFVDPSKMMDAMFQKVAGIEDPQLQMTYINGALSAMKPYMSSTDYMNLQSMVSREAENYLVKGINDPTQDKDFLGMLQGIR